MSTHNEHQWLNETIGMILMQTFTNFECLIIDDASTDETKEVLSKYNDPRLKLIFNSVRSGWLNNINLLASRAQGCLLKLQCPDDVMELKCLEEAVIFYKSNLEIGYLFSDFQWYDTSGNIVGRPAAHAYAPVMSRTQADEYALKYGCFANTSCLFVPREKWNLLGGMRNLIEPNPDRWPTSEDYELMVRLQAMYSVGYLSRPLVRVRTHSQQVQSVHYIRHLLIQADLGIIKVVWDRLDTEFPHRAKEWRELALRRIARNYFNAAVKAFFSGRFTDAKNMLGSIARNIPLRNLIFPWITEVVAPAISRRVGALLT